MSAMTTLRHRAFLVLDSSHTMPLEGLRIGALRHIGRRAIARLEWCTENSGKRCPAHRVVVARLGQASP